MKSEILKVEIF